MLHAIEYFAKSLEVIRNDTETMFVSHTVSDIFSVKEWHDLETRVRVVQGN